MNRNPISFSVSLAVLYLAAKSLTSGTVFGVCAIAEDGQGRILLVRHSYRPGWHLPGGGVDRGEPPDLAVMRELEEETGLVESAPPESLGIYTRRVLWFSHVTALYRVRNVRVDFRPNFEISEIAFCDPRSLPSDTGHATRRRIAELLGDIPRSQYW